MIMDNELNPTKELIFALKSDSSYRELWKCSLEATLTDALTSMKQIGYNVDFPAFEVLSEKFSELFLERLMFEQVNELKDVKNLTMLKVIKPWSTPYSSYEIGTVATAYTWAGILGKNAEAFVLDCNDGYFNEWFEIYK